MNKTNAQLLTAVEKYKIPTPAKKILQNHPPLLLTAITASGKNTIADYIISSTDHKETISHTTRPPRPGEINGEHYWFVDEAKMLRLVQAEAFVEIKAIHGETVYGTSIESYKNIITKGQRPLLIIDVQGVEEISRGLPELKPYFLLPPSYEAWMNRLHSRGVITEEDKANRIISAKREIATVLKNPAYILVVNDQIEATANKILSSQVDKAEQTKNRHLARNLYRHLVK